MADKLSMQDIILTLQQFWAKARLYVNAIL